jgi:hypothetical protein
MHVVCEWIGNSQTVAKKHYLQVTAEHFERAKEATQNATTSAAISGNQEGSGDNAKSHMSREIRKSSSASNGQSSPGRTRTYDKPVNSRLLYQLSYRGVRKKYPSLSGPKRQAARRAGTTAARATRGQRRVKLIGYLPLDALGGHEQAVRDPHGRRC